MKIRSGILASAVCAALPMLIAPLGAGASSHREAPYVASAPMIDSTDFYAFMSYEPGRNDYVTMIANYVPLQDAYGGPNYFALSPFALYEIHVDNDGDAKEDLTFQFQFDNNLGNNGKGLALDIGAGANKKTIAVPLKNIGTIAAGANTTGVLNFDEAYALTVVRGDRRRGTRSAVEGSGPFTMVKKVDFIDNDQRTFFGKPYDFVGNKTFGSEAGYEAYAKQFVHNVTLPGCSMPAKVFVGQRKEGFAVNLGEIFDLVNIVPIQKGSIPAVPNLGIEQNVANNDVRFKNITTIALEVHKSCLTGNGNGVIGAWTSASLRQARALNPRATFEYPEVSGGPWVQVSRLGMPLVNEVVVGLPDKDRFSGSEPKDDGQFLKYVTNPTLPALVNVLFRSTINSVLGANIADLAPTNIPRDDLVVTFLKGFPGVNTLKTVTPSEMERLNTGIPATPKATQSAFGVAGVDFAGFPNGRRPGDDVVDIELRVALGALCHLMLPIGPNGSPAKPPGITCTPPDAAIGNVQLTDGAPVSAADFDEAFPYLRTPVSGSPNGPN
jgi:hypothetical protein